MLRSTFELIDHIYFFNINEILKTQKLINYYKEKEFREREKEKGKDSFPFSFFTLFKRVNVKMGYII